MSIEILHKDWLLLAKKYCEDSLLIASLWNKIAKNYVDKNRYYHNLSNIQSMLYRVKENTKQIIDFDSLLFAIWFHDITYKSTKNNNEEKSAEFASFALKNFSKQKIHISTVSQLIISKTPISTTPHIQIISEEENPVIRQNIYYIILDAHASFKNLSKYGFKNDLFLEKMAKKDYGFSTDLLWETLWESTDDGLVIVDKDGIINEVNEASIKIHCINFKGMHISEYAKAIERFSVGKNTPAAVAELMISRALVGEKTQKKRWFLRSAARPEGYYSDTTGHTIRNEKGEITGAFVIIRDVTDFVRQEQKAQQNYKELLRESEVLWEAIPDLVFRISKDEVYLDFRIPQHEDLIASQKKLIGSRLEDHLNDDYGALTKWRKAIHQALESGKLQTTEYVLEFPEGLRYFEARIVPNGTEEVVSIVRNVSTQKESQKLISFPSAMVL